jgi:hypothetical protein
MAKLFRSEKHVFWQALIVTLIVFNFGIFLGYMLENSRVGKVSSLYAESELALLDVKIQSELFDFDIINLSCDTAIKENINFANRVYEEAKILQKFEDASKISESIRLQHKKYDLLRTLFWINSIKIKKNCNASFHDLVYFYQYNNPTLEQKAKQNVFSNLLGELKENYGGEIMLIPIAGDNNITSIDLFLEMYNVTSLPTILIDEKTKVTELTNLEELKKYLK